MDSQIVQSLGLLAITVGAGLLGKLLVLGIGRFNRTPREPRVPAQLGPKVTATSYSHYYHLQSFDDLSLGSDAYEAASEPGIRARKLAG